MWWMHIMEYYAAACLMSYGNRDRSVKCSAYKIKPQLDMITHLLEWLKLKQTKHLADGMNY